MSNEHSNSYREDITAYALGILDVDEVKSLESHLKDCQDCQSELVDYRSLKTGLLQAVPPKAPPPQLRRKLAAQLPSQRTRPLGLLATIFSQPSLVQVAMAVAVVFLLGVNIYSNMQIRELQQQQIALAERLSNEQAAIAMLAYPNTQTLNVSADVQNLTGTMLLDEDKSTAVLVLWNLPQLEENQTYQIWLIGANDERTSGGLFVPVLDQAYTTTTIQSPVSTGQYVGVGVTVEPDGGSEATTGPRVLVVDL